MATFILVHAIGVFAAVIASFVDIESIVVSGPALLVTGYFLAVLSLRSKRICGLLYGLIAPVAAIIVFAAIFNSRWSPRDAEGPLPIALVVFGLSHVPVGYLAWQEAARRDAPPRWSLQFSISSLLLLIFAVATPLGLANASGPGGLVFGAALGVGIYTNYLAILAERQRRRSQSSAGRDVQRPQADET